MKKRVMILTALITLTFSCIKCSAADIILDGVINYYEWENSGEYEAEDTEYYCNIASGGLRYKYDEKTFTMYLAVSFEENKAVGDQERKIIISVNGEKEIILGEKERIDDDYCAAESASLSYLEKDYSVEMRISLKKRNYGRIDLMFAMVDSHGIRSGNYYVNIFDGGYVTDETTVSQSRTKKQSIPKTQKPTTKKAAKVTTAPDDEYVTVILTSKAETKTAENTENSENDKDNTGFAVKAVRTASYICIGGITAAFVLNTIKKRKK